MALIAAMREQNKTRTSGYQSGDLVHPNELRTQLEALSKETLARMNAPSTFFSVSERESQTKSKITNPNPDKALIGKDANSEFLNQQNEIVSVSAKH